MHLKRALCNMLGYKLDELRGKTYRNFTPERWHALDEAAVSDQLIPNGYVDEYEKEYTAKTGRSSRSLSLFASNATRMVSPSA